MISKLLAFAMTLLLTRGSVIADPPANAKFVKGPTAARAGQQVRIDFAVDRPTDVAVFILDADDAKTPAAGEGGRIVRHLAAGVLGANAPAPLKPGSLAQSLVWDGKADYGKPVGPGPVKVRVALGLSAKYDKVVSGNPKSLSWVTAIGCGPDGATYVVIGAGGAVWQGPVMLAFSREGAYLRTVIPFPANLKADQVKAFGAMQLDGRPAPLLHDKSMAFYPDFHPAWPSNVAVSPDGKAVYLLCGPSPAIGVVAPDGSCPADKFVVPLKLAGLQATVLQSACMAVSSDGKGLYVSGLGQRGGPKGVPAVFKVALPGRTEATPFFGAPQTPGNSDTQLGGAPRGLATDGRGHLVIADYENDRVLVVNEKDGAVIARAKIEKPDYVGISAKAKAVYATHHPGKSWGVEVVKFAMPEAGGECKEVCKAAAPSPRMEYAAAFDASGAAAAAWVGGKFGELTRLTDAGDKLDSQVVSGGESNYASGPEAYLAVAVDRQRREVYARNSCGGGLYVRFSEDTDKLETVRVPGDAHGGGKGFQILPHPDGNLYGLRWPYVFYKWDRSGKPLPWDKPIRPTAEEAALNETGPIKLAANESFVPVSMVELPHTLGVRESDGHLFAFTFRVRGRVAKALHEFLPTGERVTADPIIWMTTDAVVGPKFDAAGNIYVAEVVKPKGWLYPPELAAELARLGIKPSAGAGFVANNMYGSIVKFSPKGGSFELGEPRVLPNPNSKAPPTGENPFVGQPKLDPSLKATPVEFLRGDGMKPGKVVGAEWIAPGIGHVGLFNCNCENVTFDVDPFGRTFFPDVNMYRVRVIDTNGNPITQFGGYGNAESCGPDSKDKALAQPEIALAWLVGVGVTDQCVYLGDSVNRRLLRARLVYAADETVDLK